MAPATSRLQFTVPPSMYWVTNYAILPRMRMQGERQTIKRHSASLSSQALARSAFLQLCLVVRQSDTSGTWFIHLQLHSQVKCHHISAWVSPHTNPWEQPKLGAPCGASVAIGWMVFLTSPALVLGILSIHPTPGLLRHHPVLHVPSSGCEGTLARAPPAGPSSSPRTPSMPGSGAPRRSRGRETAGAAQVTRGSLACPQRCSPGAVRKDGLASELKLKKKKKKGRKKETQNSAARCLRGWKKQTQTIKKKARVKIKFQKKIIHRSEYFM